MVTRARRFVPGAGSRYLGVVFVSVLSLATVLFAPGAVPVESASAAWELPRLYFPETGQAIGGPLLVRWYTEYEEVGVGAPVAPAIETSRGVVQWFEYGRLEARGKTLDDYSAQDIVRAPIGWIYAERVGYLSRHPAFNPVDPAETEARYFYESRHTIANDFRRIYEQRGSADLLGLPISEEFQIGSTTFQFFEFGALAWEADSGTRFVPLGKLDAAFHGFGAPPDDFRPGDISHSASNKLAISDALPGERWIEIDLSDYELIAWAGDIELLRTSVVTGPPQSPTPTGDFEIYLKYQVQDLSGIGWNGQPYYAPGTPWVMYFYVDFAVHGSTWRDSYGFGSGQGCVIPPNDVAEALWKWADYGTRVWVHD